MAIHLGALHAILDLALSVAFPRTSQALMIRFYPALRAFSSAVSLSFLSHITQPFANYNDGRILDPRPMACIIFLVGIVITTSTDPSLYYP